MLLFGRERQAKTEIRKDELRLRAQCFDGHKERMTALRVRIFNGRWGDLWPHGHFAKDMAA